jgi:hypothetical protein
MDTETEVGPEASGQKSAASLEEALQMQDEQARAANTAASEEAAAELAEVEATTNEAIAEAGAAQEARDDEVYGREPGAVDRRLGRTPEGEPTGTDYTAPATESGSASATESDYSGMTLAELQAEASARGIATSGTKAEVTARLEADDSA